MRNNTKHWMTSELDEQASFYVNRTGKIFSKIEIKIYFQFKYCSEKMGLRLTKSIFFAPRAKILFKKRLK